MFCLRAPVFGVVAYYSFRPAAQAFFLGGGAVIPSSKEQSPDAELKTEANDMNNPVW
jgi:hypothetical protein